MLNSIKEMCTVIESARGCRAGVGELCIRHEQGDMRCPWNCFKPHAGGIAGGRQGRERAVVAASVRALCSLQLCPCLLGSAEFLLSFTSGPKCGAGKRQPGFPAWQIGTHPLL